MEEKVLKVDKTRPQWRMIIREERVVGKKVYCLIVFDGSILNNFTED